MSAIIPTSMKIILVHVSYKLSCNSSSVGKTTTIFIHWQQVHDEIWLNPNHIITFTCQNISCTRLQWRLHDHHRHQKTAARTKSQFYCLHHKTFQRVLNGTMRRRTRLRGDRQISRNTDSQNRNSETDRAENELREQFGTTTSGVILYRDTDYQSSWCIWRKKELKLTKHFFSLTFTLQHKIG